MLSRDGDEGLGSLGRGTKAILGLGAKLLDPEVLGMFEIVEEGADVPELGCKEALLLEALLIMEDLLEVDARGTALGDLKSGLLVVRNRNENVAAIFRDS